MLDLYTCTCRPGYSKNECALTANFVWLLEHGPSFRLLSLSGNEQDSEDQKTEKEDQPADTVGRCIRLLWGSSCAVAIPFLDFLLLDLVSKHLPSMTNLKKIVPVCEDSA